MNKKITLTVATLMLLAFQSSAQELPKNCKQILGLDPTATDGVYTIDPDGDGPQPQMQCQCDMTTDGGGWTLVLNYNHLAGTNPDLALLTTSLPLQGSADLSTIIDESASNTWGHADTALLNALAFDEVRFYGITSNHSRVINFKSSHPGTIAYFRTGLGSTWGIQGSHTTLAGHTALMPSLQDGPNTNQGNYAMTEYPLWLFTARHWFLSPSLARWEVDDWIVTPSPSTTPSTLHQIWTRSGISYSNLEISACETYTSPSGNYTWTEDGIYMDTIPNNVGLDSILTINLTINVIDEVLLTDNGNGFFTNMQFSSYQWLDCDNGFAEIMGANGQSFAIVNSGNYAVTVTLGECELTSECMQAITVGLNDTPNVPEYSVYPNPSSSIITLKSASPFSNASITLTDLQGRTVMNMSNVNGSAVVIDISNLPSSIYTVQILDKGAISRLKLIRE
ncbi:MAG: T9SS type A sorting domain-containing protein [Flavobacteriales bacterium]|nr:T9SS type A sorting domain-containing protein [Flavobacteriales bacterium]